MEKAFWNMASGKDPVAGPFHFENHPAAAAAAARRTAAAGSWQARRLRIWAVAGQRASPRSGKTSAPIGTTMTGCPAGPNSGETRDPSEDTRFRALCMCLVTKVSVRCRPMIGEHYGWAPVAGSSAVHPSQSVWWRSMIGSVRVGAAGR